MESLFRKKIKLPICRAADNFRGFKNLKIFKVDGKNVIQSMNTMYEAKKWVEENQMPAIVHANVIRMGSHSNSDDHLLYRDENERHCVVASDPMERYRKVLIAAGKFTEDELNKIDEEVKKEVSVAHKAALKAADPSPDSIFDFVIPEPYQTKKIS